MYTGRMANPKKNYASGWQYQVQCEIREPETATPVDYISGDSDVVQSDVLWVILNADGQLFCLLHNSITATSYGTRRLGQAGNWLKSQSLMQQLTVLYTVTKDWCDQSF